MIDMLPIASLCCMLCAFSAELTVTKCGTDDFLCCIESSQGRITARGCALHQSVCIRDCRWCGRHQSRKECVAGLVTSSAPDSYKKGVEGLRQKYSQGMDFIVLTPVFLTLRQQTLQRLKDAGLKNSDGTEPRVLSYKFSADTTVRKELLYSAPHVTCSLTVAGAWMYNSSICRD